MDNNEYFSDEEINEIEDNNEEFAYQEFFDKIDNAYEEIKNYSIEKKIDILKINEIKSLNIFYSLFKK